MECRFKVRGKRAGVRSHSIGVGEVQGRLQRACVRGCPRLEMIQQGAPSLHFCPQLCGSLAPFHASLQPKGSSFTGENKDFIRFVLGNDDFIPAFEEAISGMKVRRKHAAVGTFNSSWMIMPKEALHHRQQQHAIIAALATKL